MGILYGEDRFYVFRFLCSVVFFCEKHKKRTLILGSFAKNEGQVVEVTGLEPAASCSQSRHSSQTELHLVVFSTLRHFNILFLICQALFMLFLKKLLNVIFVDKLGIAFVQNILKSD